MDKITHQVRAEYWTKIMNECINSGMYKTAWYRSNGILENNSATGILRREAFQSSSLSAAVGSDQELATVTPRTVSLPRSSFHHLLRA